MDTVNQFEGYAEAREAEYQFRLEAWLGLENPICGVEVAPLTLRRLLLLAAAGNPFVCDRQQDFKFEPYHIAEFLWVCSQSFIEGPGKRAERARRRFYRSIRRLRYLEAVGPIEEYIDRSYFDLVSGGSSDVSAPKTGWVASIAHRAASSYGWGLSEIMDTPLRQIWQLDRCQLASDPETANLLSNPLSDKVVLAELEKRNAAAAAKRKAG